MSLVYQTAPAVNLATNTFINVPIVLQFDDTPLISVIREQSLGYTTEIPIYHADGTYLAKVNGTRVFPTNDGKKAGVGMRSLPDRTVCEVAGKTIFEVFHEKGAGFRMHAELATPNGYFVKIVDTPMPAVVASSGKALHIGGMQMRNNVFQGCRIGIWIQSTGSITLGCN